MINIILMIENMEKRSLNSFVIGDKNMTFLKTRKDKCVACVF